MTDSTSPACFPTSCEDELGAPVFVSAIRRAHRDQPSPILAAQLAHQARVRYAEWCRDNDRWPLPAHTIVDVDFAAGRVALRGRTVPA